MSWDKARFVGYGVLLGTAGIKALTSRDAKKVYTHATATVLRCVEDATKTYNKVREECDDILADAKAINEQLAVEEEMRLIEDAADVAVDESEETEAAE